MAKILGYSKGEIARLYVMPTSIVVVLCVLINIPLSVRIHRYHLESNAVTNDDGVPALLD